MNGEMGGGGGQQKRGRGGGGMGGEMGRERYERDWGKRTTLHSSISYIHTVHTCRCYSKSTAYTVYKCF